MSDLIKTKVCKKCQTEQPLENFRKHPKTNDGLKNECKTCDNARQKKYYEENKKKIIQKVLNRRHGVKEAPTLIETINLPSVSENVLDNL